MFCTIPIWTWLGAIGGTALLGAGQPLYQPGYGFTNQQRYVATSVFHWYTSTGGQKSGPWRPVEGRTNWTGEPAFWQDQIKDIMDANIDVLYVHLMPSMEQQRINLFIAANQLRAQGYDLPKIAPFLDPLITWDILEAIDIDTPEGKTEFIDQYVRFFQQYFQANTDPYAESYLLHIDGRPVLDVWHCNPGYVDNIGSLTREDLRSRLATEFGSQYVTFQNNPYLIATTNGVPPNFADEIMHQFSNQTYFETHTHNNKQVATLKGGYWDQNVRTPGTLLPRDGGGHYVQAWDTLLADMDNAPKIYHAYIESWNEYDEGSGIYAADPGPPYIAPSNTSGNTDTWSANNNPRQYIDTTAIKAAAFNGRPARDADILLNGLPDRMRPGQTFHANMIVRNMGDNPWRGDNNYKLGQWEWDQQLFGPARYPLDDSDHEIPKYAGVFRGRPITLTIPVTAPNRPGIYTTHWQMLQEHVAWFGQIAEQAITVVVRPDLDVDEDVDIHDFTIFYNCLGGADQPITLPGCDQADFDRDQDVDLDDFGVFQHCLSGSHQPADFTCASSSGG